MKMRKIAVFLLVAMMAIVLSACSDKVVNDVSVEATVVSDNQETNLVDEKGEEIMEERIHIPDYETLKSWISDGYIGYTDDNNPVVFAHNEKSTQGLIIFTDASTGEAVYIEGTYSENPNGKLKISDENQGIDLEFTFEKSEEMLLGFLLNLGDLGVATIGKVEYGEFMTELGTIIEKYVFV